MDNEQQTSPAGTGSPTPTPAIKRETTPGLTRLSGRMHINLSVLDRSLMKPSHARLPILKAHNYHIWAQAHKRFLTGRGLWSMVSGETPCPSEVEETEAMNWDLMDGWILALLAGNIEESQQTHVRAMDTSKTMWDKMRRVHGVSGKGRLTPMLQRFFGYVKASDESMDKMASSLAQLSDEIYDLDPTARPSDIHMATVIMNACQGEEFAIIKQLLNETDVLTSDLAIERLRTVEKDSSRKDSSNLASTRGNRTGRPGQRNQSTDKSNIECYGCGKKGHYKYECPDENENEDNNDTSNSKNSRNVSTRPQNQRPKRKDKAALAAEGSDSKEEAPAMERVWMSVHRHQSTEATGWLIDSGATRHMTPQKELFVRMTSYHGVVEFGNHGELPVKGKGDIQVRVGRLTQVMKDVLYVPGISVNLLSIMALDRRGFHVTFGSQSVQIIDKQTNRTVASGRAKNGLYELNDSTSERVFVSQEQEALADNEAPEQRRPPPAGFELMHQRLGHAGTYRLKDLHLHANGVEDFTVPKDFQCDTCDSTKMIQTINREPRTKTTVPGARLHTDFWGPYPTGSIINGCKQFVDLIDEATGRARIRPITSKTEIRSFLIHEVRYLIVEEKRPVVVIRTDNAKEYQSAERELSYMGVSVEFTSTYTAYQNGISERFNRTVVTIARAMLEQSKLPLSFWAEAIVYACHIYNKLPSRGSIKSPEELWTGTKPDLSNERVFGCVCRVLLAKEQRQSKLHAVSYLGIYTGYHSRTQYRVYRPDKNRFDWPTNVKFYEDRIGLELLPQGLLPRFDEIRAEVSTTQPNNIETTSDVIPSDNESMSGDDGDQNEPIQQTDVTTLLHGNEQNVVLGEFVSEGDPSETQLTAAGESPQPGPPEQRDEGNSPPASNTSLSNTETPQETSNENSSTTNTSTISPQPESSTSTPIRRSVEPTAATFRPTRTRKPATRTEFFESFGKGKDKALYAPQDYSDAFIQAPLLQTEPQTYREATTGRYAREWKLAIAKELEALTANHTWELTTLPPGRKAVTCKWVFKIKYTPTGAIDRYKARLVARGFTQVEGIDFDETFAPTLRFESLRLLFALAIHFGLMIHQLDVDNAYLNSDLPEEIYMIIPDGYPTLVKDRDKVLRLLKGLYGLKQSARIWNQRFESTVTKMGFKAISSDKCVFIRTDTKNSLNHRSVC